MHTRNFHLYKTLLQLVLSRVDAQNPYIFSFTRLRCGAPENARNTVIEHWSIIQYKHFNILRFLDANLRLLYNK